MGWYTFLLHNQISFLAFPKALNRLNNIKINTARFINTFNKNYKSVNNLSYIKNAVMPLVDEDYQSISS